MGNKPSAGEWHYGGWSKKLACSICSYRPRAAIYSDGDVAASVPITFGVACEGDEDTPYTYRLAGCCPQCGAEIDKIILTLGRTRWRTRRRGIWPLRWTGRFDKQWVESGVEGQP